MPDLGLHWQDAERLCVGSAARLVWRWSGTATLIGMIIRRDEASGRGWRWQQPHR